MICSRDRPAQHPRSAVLPDAGRAVPLSAGQDRAQGLRPPDRHPGPAAERGADPFRFPPQPVHRLSPGLRRLLGLRLGAHRGRRVRRQPQPEAHRAAQRRSGRAPRSPAEATREQFALLRTYLDSRHSGGGMSDMGLFDYVAMVEETPVDTHIVEYRRPRDGSRLLIACALTDVLRDGLVDGLQLLSSRRGCAQPGHLHDPGSCRGGAGARACRTSISAIGCAAPTRWTTSRASRRWKRWAPTAGNVSARECNPSCGLLAQARRRQLPVACPLDMLRAMARRKLTRRTAPSIPPPARR